MREAVGLVLDVSGEGTALLDNEHFEADGREQVTLRLLHFDILHTDTERRGGVGSDKGLQIAEVRRSGYFTLTTPNLPNAVMSVAGAFSGSGGVLKSVLTVLIRSRKLFCETGLAATPRT